jgi:hypothetical protein
MKIKHFAQVAFTIATLMLVESARAGWNYGSRNNCKILAKYRVEIHAGWTSSSGGGGNLLRDTGCTYAHAGPLRYYTSNSKLLSEAEGYIGNSAFWGYARSWTIFDPIPALLKKGVAAEPTAPPSEKAAAPSVQPARSDNEFQQSASNHFYIEDVRFDEPKKPKQKCITLKNVTANLVAETGYSVVEIIVWNPKDDIAKKMADTDITPAKIVWRARAIVHENRLVTEGEFPKDLFSTVPAAFPDQMQKETVHVINNKSMTITLPSTVNLDRVEVCIKGDTGDESILQPKR